MCRERSTDNKSACTAATLADFFEAKVNKIRAATDGSPPLSFVDAAVDSPLRQFKPLCSDDITKLVRSAPPKQSDLDPLRTWLLKDRIELLSPYITHLIKHISVDRQRA